MNIESLPRPSRVVIVRGVMVLLSVVGLALSTLGVIPSLPLLTLSGVFGFLGITNFGRQCPLLSVVRRALRRSGT